MAPLGVSFAFFLEETEMSMGIFKLFQHCILMQRALFRYRKNVFYFFTVTLRIY